MQKNIKFVTLFLCFGLIIGCLTSCGTENAVTTVGSTNEAGFIGTMEVDNANVSDVNSENKVDTSNIEETNKNDTVEVEEDNSISVLSEVVVHNADGTNYIDKVCEYDNIGNLISEKMYDVNGSYKEYVYYYDTMRNMVKREYLTSEGILKQRLECEYDVNGNMIKQCVFNSEDKLISGTEYGYTDNGEQIKSCSYDKDANEWITEFEQRYDDEGVLIYSIKRGHLNHNAPWHSLEECFYDTSGKLIKKNEHYHYGYEVVTEVEHQIEYIYDDNKLVETLYYDADGKLKDRYIHEEYDSGGKVLTEYWYIGDAQSYNSKFVYEYDDQGRMIKRNQYDSQGKLAYWTDYTYVEGTKYCKATSHNVWFGNGELVDVYDCEFDECTGHPINYVMVWGDPQKIGNFYEFDDSGHLIKAERHTEDGTTILLYSAQYDENGTLRKEHGMDYSDCPDEFEYEREYDELGNLIKETIWDGINTSVYDSRGELMQFVQKYNDTTTVRIYDEAGNMTEYQKETSDEQKHNIYEYDENSNLLKMTSTNHGELDYWEEYIYKDIVILE